MGLLLDEGLVRDLLQVPWQVSILSQAQAFLTKTIAKQIAGHGMTNARQLDRTVGQSLREIAAQVAEACKKCEERLELLFGPFTRAQRGPPGTSEAQ